MSGYAKVFASTLDSSIWAGTSATKVVWITMLLLADQDGMVHVSAPGLAHRSRESLEDTTAALEVFLSPDPHSRTPAHEGRRIERVDGVGYRILNHDSYRRRMSTEDRKEKDRLRAARKRSDLQSPHESASVPISPHESASVHEIPQAEVKALDREEINALGPFSINPSKQAEPETSREEMVATFKSGVALVADAIAKATPRAKTQRG